ncbi:MAG: hypothetical protein ABI854_12120 [Betaproteobacteria bacterium]
MNIRLSIVVAGLLLALTGSTVRAEVIEFYNTILDNYFITADDNEAAAIDSGSAGPGWMRTGDTFNSGGSTPVCRFYGSISPGPNSHFYTALASECASLKQLQASTPSTQKRWNFESLDFYTTAATNGTCPAATVPIYRAYNNGFARGVDSNHRITPNAQAIQDVVARGWISEGVVMCGATDQTVGAIAQFWLDTSGVWIVKEGGQLTPNIFRFDNNGNYLQGIAQGATPGLERGKIAYDPLSGHFTGIVAQDTNGASGLSSRSAEALLYTLRLEAGRLVVRQADGTEVQRLQRIPNAASTIVGAWALGTADDLRTQTFAFLADGHYMMIDPIGDDGTPSCGGPGVEYGTYTWDGATGTLRITGVSIDTNGCSGLNEPPSPTVLFGPGDHSISGIELEADGSALTITADDGVFVLLRIS